MEDLDLVYLSLPPLERYIYDHWEELTAANPYGCNGSGHAQGCPQKGTTREPRTPSMPHRVHRVDQRLPMHKQVTDLCRALEKAQEDGAHFEAVITRPEFGELMLDCGSSQKNGVSHVMLERHSVSLLLYLKQFYLAGSSKIAIIRPDLIWYTITARLYLSVK